MSVELYETHVAAEEVDHLAQIARLLILRIGEVYRGTARIITKRDPQTVDNFLGRGCGGGSLVTAKARCQSV
jgi:hypothetical protein